MLTNYEYFVREIYLKNSIDGVEFTENALNIGIRNKIDGTVSSSPLTNFIIKNYESANSKLNTAKAPAAIIVRFMNFVNSKIEEGDPDFIDLKQSGIKGLNLQHGSRFISHQAIVKLNKEKTIKQYQDYLSDFFVFLNTEGLNNNYPIKPTTRRSRFGKKTKGYCVSFGDAPEPPAKVRKDKQKQTFKKLKDFGGNRLIMTIEFIEVAKRLYPDMALGVYLMFYGGLRRGEVVNLTHDSLNYKKNSSCILLVRNRTIELFSHIKSNSKNQVKSERDQIVLMTPLLEELIKNHKKYYRNHPTALFANRYGKPLTGRSFERRFKTIRKLFEKELSKKIGRRSDYEIVKFVSWQNHIGRGVFTNFLLSMGMPLTEVSIARGDSSGEALKDYIEELNAQAALLKASEILGNEYRKYIAYKEQLKKDGLDDKAISTALEKGVAKIEPERISTFKELWSKVI
ncbi:site-specific integrase [Cytobacillus kochii]|uniref:site-specific integrase n=1 Tax=Cytobacillus kochii TaxID=859143 RepID=UPI00203CE0A6|nr:site-specific integrase [Cytobacillus kochii]MCM3323301.1 site-specific integrase [Cytobacillus kochii]MCM3345696.1 site-specific integrase [Cytobacillus kochii]